MAVGIGILGGGIVGGALLQRLIEDRDALTARTGLELQVRRVAIRSPEKTRVFPIPDALITTSPRVVIDDPEVQLVVEVMGGLEPAGELVLAALRAGKPVVTANKELVAARGVELLEEAARAGVSLLFEASVGGGIPIIRPLTETLAGESLTRVMGIVNGTTNYLLTRMTEDGASFEEALEEAQARGFAESDPTADISGADAVAKAAILASLAFGTVVSTDQVYREGIENVQIADVGFAADLGYVLKLLAIADKDEDGITVRVHPTLVPRAHPLASVRGVANAVFVEGPEVGELLFSGPGAGGGPTATAVLGDIIDAARELLAGPRATPRVRFGPGHVRPFEEATTKWYIRLHVLDAPGVLANIAGAFGKADVSIKSVWQEGRGDEATLLLITHDAREAHLRAAVASLEDLDEVREVAASIRVQSDEP
ncbi:homoserine dehydrogenase [bacterium BMS3Abin02]|nr:homoserine dehydrogenase [bacterium BMS3Abin02]GBE23084.1 homoserine dehydrogenase [bacterium BMS3Bbin01]HDH26685.1 homoserine dehydrogenase [Actinomycetota bacterium]HDK45923.1 homoserine dehydrogenase [Actinomycetota bacterium]HDL49261.1 homoserine dehydrogenase [Actinomycetota bacterium]